MDSAKQPPPPVVSMDSPPPSSSKRPCPSQTENPSLQCPSHVELASHLSPTHIKTHHFLHFTPQRDHQQHIILNRKPKHQQLFYDSNPIKLHKLNMTLSSKTPCMVEEEEEVLQEQQQNNRAASSSSLHGSVSVIGRRRRMEDAVKVIPGFMGCYHFFAVFDGHGGATVANACRDRMHLLVAEEVKMLRENDEKRGFDFWYEAMSSSFLRMDREVGGGNGGCDGDLVGSTAAVVVVGEDEVVVANCGDSRAVLCHGGVAIPLSTYHKPNRPDERERVEKAGGKVINWNGGDRVLGILSTSRSIGDHSMKPFVVCEPEVKVYERREKDEFLIIASDGLWDVISNKMACEVVWRIFKMQFGASEAAAMLAELAMVRGSRDNISVIVVRLQ